MSTVKNLFNHIRSNRRKFAAILGSLILIILFQNCGGIGSTGAESTSPSLATSVPNPPGTTPPPVVAPPVVAPPVAAPPMGPPPLALDVQRANCNSAMGTPTLSSISLPGTMTAATSAVISSGLGSVNSGDSRNPPAFDFVVDRGITNAATFNTPEYNCNSHLSVRLRCAVVATNPGNPADSPLAITNAYDPSGNSLLATAAMTLARGSYNNNDCESQLGLGVSNGQFRITPATANQRCVQGTFWLAITAQSAIAGIGTSTRNSTPRYFKVTVNNGCWVESRLKDSAGDLSRVINFGTAVAINGNWAAVVAPTDDASATVLDVGSVYMYMFDGRNWVQKQRLLIGGAAAMSTIASVAIRGDSMVIGSPYQNGTGAAYFFRRGGETWTQIGGAINPPNAGANQAFGQTLAINDRYVFIGSPNYSGALSKNGGVAVYSHNSGGVAYAKTIFGASANMAFGSSIAVDNTVLAVGAPQALGREGSAPGSVFVFDEAGGAFNLAVTKTGTVNAEKFGTAVAVFGNRLAVGSPNYIVGGVAGFGRATYYDNYMVATATRTFQGGAATDNLGQSVALSNTGLYVGVPFANARAGRVDHYLYGNIAAGTLYYRNLAYNESTNSGYGYSVAVAGDFVIIGARIKSDPNDNSGAAYIYRYK